MARQPDTLTPDLFAGPTAPEPGSLACSVEIARTMSEAVSSAPHSRSQIADRMSRYLGASVSVAMLNAYTSEARETHNVNLERAIAFDHATERFALLALYSRKCNARALRGPDVLLAELGRLEQEKREMAEREKALRLLLKSGR